MQSRLFQKSATILEKRSAVNSSLTLPEPVIFCSYKQYGRLGRQDPSLLTNMEARLRKRERFDLLEQDSGPGYVLARTTENKTYKGEYGRGVNSPGRE